MGARMREGVGGVGGTTLQQRERIPHTPCPPSPVRVKRREKVFEKRERVRVRGEWERAERARGESGESSGERRAHANR
eukprot:scaffold249485_cov36-Tisochrysis_lutea.AAC.1